MKRLRKRFTFIVGLSLLAPLLAACSGQSTPSDTQTPQTSVPADASTVSATGQLVPAQWTTLSFAQAGQVTELAIKEGDVVKAGDVLARLDAADLEASLLQMQAAQKAAEANLALASAGPRSEDVEAARQAVQAAQARTAEAVAQRDRLYSSLTQADVLQAESQAQAVQLQVDVLHRQMDQIIETGGRALAAGEMLDLQIKYAEYQLAAAQAHLKDLTDGPNPDQLRIANARVWLASSQENAAQARLDLVLAGPLPEDVAIAQARLDQARADVAATQAQLDQTEIAAPYDATVASVFVDAHQFAGPGQPILQIADLSGLRVETTDLNEIDVTRLETGDRMTVSFEALPGAQAVGTVERIAPKADDGVGVNYAVVLKLDEMPAGVRWGMTAIVDFVAGSPAGEAAQSNLAAEGSTSIGATGKVLPGQKSTLAFVLPGQLLDLKVDVGAAVKQGDVLARLDTAALDAEVGRAEAALKLAQAGLERVKAGPRPEQAAESKSNLEAASAGSAQAAANRDAVKAGPTEAEIATARAAVVQATIDMMQVRTQHDLLRKAYDGHPGSVSQDKLDDAARALAIASQNLAAAQARLDKLLSGADPDALKAANAALGAASADYQSLQAQVDKVLAGAQPEDIAVAQASVEQAQAALERAQLARSRAELVAPFDGVVSQVFVRQFQYVAPGAPILLLADLPHLHVETTDLSEKDISRVTVGSGAKISFDALPGVDVEGTVSGIAPKSEAGTGVNYTVTIDLANIPEKLRWGMTAFVDIPSK